MDTVIIAVLVLIISAIVYLWLIAPRRQSPDTLEQFTGRQFAHRGLHDAANGIPENTLAAFRRAADSGYGMEFDVRLTSDGQLVVMHDDKLERMTGARALVSRSTLAQLEELRVGGTDQPVPRFEQVLELVDGRVPLIIELKVSGSNHAQLAAAVCRVLDGYSGPYVVESFDPRLVLWFRRNRPDIVRGQLMERARLHGDKRMPALLDFIIYSQMINCLVRPDFVAINHADRDILSMRMSRQLYHTPEFDWTVTGQPQADASEHDGSAFIFEGFIPSAHK